MLTLALEVGNMLVSNFGTRVIMLAGMEKVNYLHEIVSNGVYFIDSDRRIDKVHLFAT